MDGSAGVNMEADVARSELRANLKFKRLLRSLDMPPPYVLGLLECMWQVGYQSGSDILGTAEDVELAAEWPGKSGAFFEAIRRDWLDERSGKFHIHDLYDHAPEYVKKKMQRRQSLKDNELQHKTADNGGESPPNVGSTQPNPTNPTKQKLSSAEAEPRPPKSTPGFQPLVDFFCERWQLRYGVDYKFGGKDGRLVKWILARVELEEAKEIVANYLADNDNWLVEKHRHSFGQLVSNFNKYRVLKKAKNAGSDDYAIQAIAGTGVKKT